VLNRRRSHWGLPIVGLLEPAYCVVFIRYAEVEVRVDSIVNVLIEGTGAVLPVVGRRGVIVDGEGR
jgi:hypothetical protein